MSLVTSSPTKLTGAPGGWWMQKHFVRAMVAGRLLKPLGNPPANSVKFFAALALLELVKDKAWLAKVTNALNQHWQKKNAAKQNQPAYNHI